MTFEVLADKVIPPWVKWLGALVVVAVIIGAIYAYGQQQFGLGERAEAARWLARENAELVAANAEIASLTFKKFVEEKAHEERLTQAATDYQKEKQREKVKTDAVLADLRTGNAGLFYHLASQSAGACRGRETVASSGGSDGGTETQLPREIAADIFAEADRANGIVRQLNLCQQVIIEDRKVCGQ